MKLDRMMGVCIPACLELVGGHRIIKMIMLIVCIRMTHVMMIAEMIMRIWTIIFIEMVKIICNFIIIVWSLLVITFRVTRIIRSITIVALITVI